MRIEALFSPSSIAVVGASTRSGSVGNNIVKNLVLQGFSGSVFPVNPHAEILFEKKCFSKIADIPGAVDLCIVAVPAPSVVGVVKEAIEKKVSAIIVISAGFRETGNVREEEEIRSLCDKSDIVLLGPNCLGVIHPKISMNASFASRMPKAGSVAFLSQSGALCTAMLDYATKKYFGFSKFVSIGNKAQLDEAALIRFLADDEDTHVVVLYVEELRNAREFLLASDMLRLKGKPLLVMKSGLTISGSGASASHTGAIAGNDAVYDALFERSGAIRVRDLDDLFEYLPGFIAGRFPVGDRVAILTNAGGPGVLATDEVVLRGMRIADLSAETQDALSKFLPPAANFRNPVDILGDADCSRYKGALQAILDDASVDSAVVVLTPQSMTEIPQTAKIITDFWESSKKPLVAAFMGGSSDIESGVSVLEEKGVPTSRFPQKSVRALAALYQYGKERNKSQEEEFSPALFSTRNETENIFERYQQGGEISLVDSMEFLTSCGFSVANTMYARSVQEAREAIERIGGTGVLKIVSPDISHKSDVGGVVAGVSSDTIEEAYQHMMDRVRRNVPNARIEGVIISEMILEKGVECILGSVRDPNLGHAVMAGFGGVYVEVFRDIAFGLVPVSKTAARSMIEKLRCKALLRGARGGEIMDEEAFLDAIGRLSTILERYPKISEIDINPLLVLPQGKGTKVLDARIFVG